MRGHIGLDPATLVILPALPIKSRCLKFRLSRSESGECAILLLAMTFTQPKTLDVELQGELRKNTTCNSLIQTMHEFNCGIVENVS